MSHAAIYTLFVKNLISPEALAAAAVDESAALAKQERMLRALGALDSLLVALSGGADSAYLSWAAHRVLGKRALAITAVSASYSSYDRRQSNAFSRSVGLRHEFIHTFEFDNSKYTANNADRCYHCKDELFNRLEELARERGFAAIAYGINADDTHDFRPGHRAAYEHKALAPLLEARLTKGEIRFLSRMAKLPTWDRPASACLSSRVPYGTPVTPGLLRQIERAESALRRLGFRQFRVRAHGPLASVELAGDELARGASPQMSREISTVVRQAGFTAVRLDPQGYRPGSLNATLKK